VSREALNGYNITRKKRSAKTANALYCANGSFNTGNDNVQPQETTRQPINFFEKAEE